MNVTGIEMANEAYHADVSRISKSGLDLISKSPAHFYARYLDPNRETSAPTPAMRLGSLTHSFVLEYDTFFNNYVIAPELNKRTNDGKAAWAAFEQANAGKTVITLDEYDHAKKIRDAVMAHPAAAMLLKKGKSEQVFHFTEPKTGVHCKIKPDFLSEDTGFIVDLKTTTDASAKEFGRSAFNYRYHVQGAFYGDGIYYATNQQVKGFVFIAVEKDPPFAVAVYYLDQQAIELGREAYLNDLETYKKCVQTGAWPAYGYEVTPLLIPDWAFKKL